MARIFAWIVSLIGGTMRCRNAQRARQLVAKRGGDGHAAFRLLQQPIE